jgi:ABC-type multidrug transport system fused ATPase/permease subunit
LQGILAIQKMMNKSTEEKQTLIQKLRFLLNPQQKKQLVVLSLLLIIGMLFEMAGLGVLIPALGLMLNTSSTNDYPSLQPILNILGNPSQKELVLYGMIFLVILYLLKALFLVFLSWRQSKFSAEFSAELSSRLFFGYLRQPYSFHLKRNSAELLRNIRGEVAELTELTKSVIILTIEFTVIVGIGFLLILQNPLGTIVVTLLLGLSSLGVYRLSKKRLLNWGQRRQSHEGEMNQHLMQGIGGVKEVKLYGKEENFLKEFDKHNYGRARVITWQYTMMFFPRLYLEFMAVVALAGAVITMIIQGMPLAEFVPTLGIFVAGAFRMIPSVNRIMGSVQFIRYSGPVVDVLYKECKLISNVGPLIPQTDLSVMNFNNNIVLEQVNFSYALSNHKSLNNISLNISKGESIGFIGSTGSGKSTLIDVILGLLPIDSGRLTVDGKSIYDNLRKWQKQIGYVPQTIYLTDDTIRRNIAFGVPNELINNDAVEKAIIAAQMSDFVKTLPEGLETFVGEDGVRLSGGQRQRIGLARALYNDPSILVLDEATSALDSNTENDVMEAVLTLKNSKTIIIVAHRLSTLNNCDRIYKLENGKISQQGKPVDILSFNSNV